MSFAIGAVSSLEIQEQIPLALKAYGRRAQAWFNIAEAASLELTPDKPNTARSRSEVRLGRFTASLYVIAFMPGDGTGDESAHNLSEFQGTKPYPETTAVVPRDKSATQREIYLPIATYKPSGDAALFSGCLDLITINEANSLGRLGYLGQTPEDFKLSAEGQLVAKPQATYTLWRMGLLDFGGEHAVYNSTGLLQVCGFIALPRGMDTDLIDAFEPKMPECVYA